MSKKIDISENDLGVLALFTEGYDRKYYIRYDLLRMLREYAALF